MDQQTGVHIPGTLGALLLGGLIATGLSGMVFVQGILYFKTFDRDANWCRALVGSVLILDLLHISLVWTALWHYLINTFGDSAGVTTIIWPISMSVVCTALLTFLVHWFFAIRIFQLSHRKWWLAGSIMVLAFMRLVSAVGTASAMGHYGTFVAFKDNIRWIFTTGLVLSTTVDVIITATMWALLDANRREAPSMVHVLNVLLMYAFETGIITCVGTIAVLCFWIVMSDNNLTFLGAHFVISKLYATSLLITLNARKDLLPPPIQFRTTTLGFLGDAGKESIPLPRFDYATETAELRFSQIGENATVTEVARHPCAHLSSTARVRPPSPPSFISPTRSCSTNLGSGLTDELHIDILRERGFV